MKTALLAFMLLVGACASTVPRTEVFRAQEFTPYSSPGAGEISGRVWVSHEGPWDAESIEASRAVVRLVPVTTYTKEWFDREIKGGENLSAEDPRLASFRRIATTDYRGRFRFSGLPAGEYYLVSRFFYDVEDVFDTEGGVETFQAVAKARVSLDEGELRKSVDVTQ